MNLYYVGGYVRDRFLGLQSKDIDFAVEAESYDEMRDYLAANGTIFLEKPEFFTIRAMMAFGDKRIPADFVLCRKESGYTDGRHPDKVEVGTIYDDLARRDFTMNAIAIKVSNGQIIDPFGGVVDIRNGIIRCVGSPRDRLSEDPLRILRALRFSITKPMWMDAELANEIRHQFSLYNFKGVSVERKREELAKMFQFDTLDTLNLLNDYRDVLEACFNYDDGIWLMPTMKGK